jgi:hypothetical protein
MSKLSRFLTGILGGGFCLMALFFTSEYKQLKVAQLHQPTVVARTNG